MRMLMLIGITLPLVSGTAKGFLSGAMGIANTSQAATKAMRAAIQAARPTVQLPVSADKFVDVLLAEICKDCRLLHITPSSLDGWGFAIYSSMPSVVNKARGELRELYFLLGRQQRIDESAESWQQELAQVENDNYQQLLEETKTAIDRMLADLNEVYLEYKNEINEIPDAELSGVGLGVAGSLAGAGSATWDMKGAEFKSPLRDDEREKRPYNSTDDDLALLGAAVLMSNGQSDDSPTSALEHPVSIFNNPDRKLNLNLVSDEAVGKAYTDMYGDRGSGVLGNNSPDDNSIDTGIDLLDLLFF